MHTTPSVGLWHFSSCKNSWKTYKTKQFENLSWQKMFIFSKIRIQPSPNFVKNFANFAKTHKILPSKPMSKLENALVLASNDPKMTSNGVEIAQGTKIKRWLLSHERRLKNKKTKAWDVPPENSSHLIWYYPFLSKPDESRVSKILGGSWKTFRS